MATKKAINIFLFYFLLFSVQGQTIKIMPLGNSITQGEDASVSDGFSYNTYRRLLWHQLVDTLGYDVDFIGSEDVNYPCGTYSQPDFDLDHEGHWSWRVDHVLYGRSGACDGDGRLGLWLQEVGAPDIALVHLGTNDCWASQPTAGTADEIRQVIDTLRAYNPEVTVLLCQIIGHQSASIQANIDQLNDSIPNIIADKNDPCSQIILVDQASGFNPFTDLYDSAHPNTLGEQKMSDQYLEKIVPVLDSLTQGGAGSMYFEINEVWEEDDYGKLTNIPLGFGSDEFSFQMWIKPDTTYPIGPVSSGIDQITNWYDGDPPPYDNYGWWFSGNFLLDGHNNGSWDAGTFSLQFYAGGRLRWHFGDGTPFPNGDPFVLQADTTANVPSLLDGSWHLITCQRKAYNSGSILELWVDDYQVAQDTSDYMTDMRTYWDSWSSYTQPGWFLGAEKQAAENTSLLYYEDYKGLLENMKFYNRSKSASEINDDYNLQCASGIDMVGLFAFNENGGAYALNAIDPLDTITWYNNAITNWACEEIIETQCDSISAWYVSENETGSGTSWGDASGNLPLILNNAKQGDTIRISAGSYLPTIGTSRDIAFEIKKGVTILGGYPVGGSSDAMRDPNANITLLNGDIGLSGNSIDNSYQVVRIGSLNANCLLDGVRIGAGTDSNAASILTSPTNKLITLNNVVLLDE